jgi:hypothetical protein
MGKAETERPTMTSSVVCGVVEQGLAPECLCSVAEAESAALIMVGTNGDRAPHASVVGSVSLATTRMAAVGTSATPVVVCCERT